LERRRKVLDLLGALCERLTPEERQMLDALNAEAADELGLPRLKDLANPGRAPHCAGRSP
jgi:hypothetical protein